MKLLFDQKLRWCTERIGIMLLNRRIIGSRGAFLLIGLALVELLAKPVEAQSYKLTILQTLSGSLISGFGVNNKGQVGGDGQTVRTSDFHAFLFDPSDRSLHDLGTLPGRTESFGEGGINLSGQVAGQSRSIGGISHAFLSGVNGQGLSDLGTLPGGINSYGYNVNDAGQVVGASDTTSGKMHAFVSAPGGGMLHDLGTLGGNFSEGLGINASAQVTGYSDTAVDGAFHAFLSDTSGGLLHDLGTLSGGVNSHGSQVNSDGEVVGYSDMTGGNTHAFLTGSNGIGMRDLGTLGGTDSYGYGVNATGQAVGYSWISGNSGQDAFIYSNGVMTDLNNLVAPGSDFTLVKATSISDTGFITGFGVGGGQELAFLLTPIPEASTTVSLGFLLFFGAVLRQVCRLVPTIKEKTNLQTLANEQHQSQR